MWAVLEIGRSGRQHGGTRRLGGSLFVLVLMATPVAAQGTREGPVSAPVPASRRGPDAPAGRITTADWPAPLRISQAGTAPPGALPPGEAVIQPVVPLPADGPREIEQVPLPSPMPFQHRLPGELLPQPPTPEARQQMGRFIPQIIDPQQDLNLLVGHPRILMFAEWATKPQMRLYLPDESIARWDIISDTEIALVGLQPGTTVLSVWFNDPTTETGKRVLSFRLRVFEDPLFRETLADLEKQLAELFPDSYVKLTIVRDRLVVRGQAKDAVEAGQILTLLAQTRAGRRHTGLRDSAAQETVTNLFIDQDRFEQEDLAAVRRSVMDSTAVARAGIINLLEIPGEQQVMLRVIVAEVNRDAVRSIGGDVQIGSGDVQFLSLLSRNTLTAAVANNQTAPGVVLPNFTPRQGGNLLVNTSDFRLALNILRDLGYARTLAEPNVVALNGQTATFFAGNRVPIPQATAGFGAVGQGVAFEQVGVTLSFTPFLTDRDRVRLQIAGSVSTLDATGQVNIGGSNVSAQDARTVLPTVELRDGQTLAMAGLLSTTLRGRAQRVPFLGDLPVIGTLFTNKSIGATEQELVVLVTPELAHPLEAGCTPPLPGSDVFEPTDVEFYLGNRLESRRSTDFRSPVRTDYHRIKQFQRYCHDQYIIGPSGYSQGGAPGASACPPPAAYELRDRVQERN